MLTLGQYGNRALEHAAEKGLHENIKVLIDTLGADVHVCDTVSALSSGLQSGHINSMWACCTARQVGLA